MVKVVRRSQCFEFSDNPRVCVNAVFPISGTFGRTAFSALMTGIGEEVSILEMSVWLVEVERFISILYISHLPSIRSLDIFDYRNLRLKTNLRVLVDRVTYVVNLVSIGQYGWFSAMQILQF